MKRYPATAHLAGHLSVMCRMMVMMLSGMDALTTTINARTESDYTTLKGEADMLIASSFVDDTFTGLKISSLLTTLGTSHQLPEDQKHAALMSLLRNHKSTLKRLVIVVYQAAGKVLLDEVIHRKWKIGDSGEPISGRRRRLGAVHLGRQRRCG